MEIGTPEYEVWKIVMYTKLTLFTHPDFIIHDDGGTGIAECLMLSAHLVQGLRPTYPSASVVIGDYRRVSVPCLTHGPSLDEITRHPERWVSFADVNIETGMRHAWVEIPDENMFVDAVHDHFLPSRSPPCFHNGVTRVSDLNLEEYNRNYKIDSRYPDVGRLEDVLGMLP